MLESGTRPPPRVGSMIAARSSALDRYCGANRTKMLTGRGSPGVCSVATEAPLIAMASVCAISVAIDAGECGFALIDDDVEG